MNPAFISASPLSTTNRAVFPSAQVSPLTPRPSAHPQAAKWTMGGKGKQAKFGIFTPAVLTAKVILGDKRLNKIRGKGIALHSQAITSFCEFTGAGSKTRQALIRQAKMNGDTLGFLS